MNSQSHRLIFNPTRGCLMAVAETSRSCGKSGAAGSTRNARAKRVRCRRADGQASNWPSALADIAQTAIYSIAFASTFPADKNTLQTQSLTSSDLDNKQNTNSSSSSTSIGYSGASTGATMAQNAMSNAMGNMGAGAGLPENGSQSGKTLSVISPSAITITGTGNAKTDAASATQVATLTSRDATTANKTLTNTLTLQQAQGIQAKQQEAQENAQAGQLVGSVAFNLVGDIAAKNKWQDGSPQKIALHAVAGYIQASAGGQKGATGALAAMGNEALTKVVNDAIDKALPLPANATEDQRRENTLSRKALAESAATLLGATSVALAGGVKQDIALGGNVALNADRFNRQLHPDEKAILRARAKAKAEEIAKARPDGLKDEKYVSGLTENLYLALADESTALIDAKEKRQNTTYRQQLEQTKQPGLEGFFGADDALALSNWARSEARVVQKEYAGQTVQINGKDLIADGGKVQMFQATTEQYTDSRLFNTAQREILLKQFAGNTDANGKQDVEPAVRVGLDAYRQGTADAVDSRQQKTVERLRATNGAAAFDSSDIDLITLGVPSAAKAGVKKVAETVTTALERRAAEAEAAAAAEKAVAKAKVDNNAGRDGDALSTDLVRGNFRNEPHVVANPDVLAGLLKQGGVELKQGVTTQDIFQRVIQQPPGLRLAPEEYLNPTFISKELARYDEGATRIVLKSNFERWGIGQADGTSFVMPKSEADALIKSAGSDPVKLADALGLPRSALDGNSLVRVDIPNPRQAGLRLPSGNEAGANSNWIPGGKLPGGASEAVIDANKIVKFDVTPIKVTK